MFSVLTVLRFALWSAFALFGGSPSHAQPARALLLFGGDGHKTFLGCLNCSAKRSDSVCNRYSKYGSKADSDSIWNQSGDFGSKFSSQSPWNEIGTDAPIIVDMDGNSYGYFSANAFHQDRTQIKPFVAVLDSFSETGSPDGTRALACGD